MKKNFCKALAMLFVVFMMMNTVAFAETTEVEPAAGPGINAPDGEENIITVTLSGLTAGEEATILVVNDGVVGVEVTENEVTRTTTLADVEDTDIVYINQDTIPDGGIVTFELDASNATGTKVDIFCGYTSIEAAADVLVAEDVTISAVSAPSVNTAEGASKAYDATPVEGFTRVFIELTTAADAANWTPVHDGEGSEIYYSADRAGYDCLLNTEATTLADILAELEWTNEAPTSTIAKYGDYDANGAIGANDVLGVKQHLLGISTVVTKKQMLVGDVDGNSSLGSNDVLGLKQVILGLISETDFNILK